MPNSLSPIRLGWIGLFVVACAGGSTDDAPRTGANDGTAAASPGSASPADSTGAVAPMDTGPWMLERGDSASSSANEPTTGGWTRDATSGGGNGFAALTAIRVARHDGYDRVVFEFDSPVPSYRAEWVERPSPQCGSGFDVEVGGRAWLEVGFTPASAHTDAGNPTTERRVEHPNAENLQDLRLVCDFEGHVEWVLGAARTRPYRAFVLDAPARLVVDVRH